MINGRITIIIMHNINRNLDQDINKEEEEKEKIVEKITNPIAIKEYINPDLDNATNNMIEEFIEKTNKICELAVELGSYYSNRCPIPTQ